MSWRIFTKVQLRHSTLNPAVGRVWPGLCAIPSMLPMTWHEVVVQWMLNGWKNLGKNKCLYRRQRIDYTYHPMCFLKSSYVSKRDLSICKAGSCQSSFCRLLFFLNWTERKRSETGTHLLVLGIVQCSVRFGSFWKQAASEFHNRFISNVHHFGVF